MQYDIIKNGESHEMHYISTAKISRDFKETIPAELRKKYSSLSFSEMAQVPELSQYSKILELWEHDWNILESSI